MYIVRASRPSVCISFVALAKRMALTGEGSPYTRFVYFVESRCLYILSRSSRGQSKNRTDIGTAFLATERQGWVGRESVETALQSSSGVIAAISQSSEAICVGYARADLLCRQERGESPVD